ncbi:MAG TPA: DUF6798 domain-containing protein [Tepidisphaeraceae bacterium]|nr:DUF6798 domain-containing protein [Tepidisphaeraceae bacterium]
MSSAAPTSPAPPAPLLDSRTSARVTALDGSRFDSLGIAFAVLFGIVMSLCVEGYQFGRSNHTVYLLDALRKTQPELLANDWFTTQTLQYHATFGWLTATLYRLGVVEPAFLLGYLVLATMFHLGWYGLVMRIGGRQSTYLLSLLLFYLSAGGFGLGMYQFLQDGSFLPSNVANIALLWAIVLWLHRSFLWAGLAMGVAGLFHLNHAIVGLGLWSAMVLWELWRPTIGDGPRPVKGWLIGTALAVVPSAANIGMALSATMTRSSAMPLAEFVDIYVRLRHPHHYDPSTWPAALWLCFLWPIPLAVVAARLSPPAVTTHNDGTITHPTAMQARFARAQAARFFLLFCALLVVALVGAGIWYFHEALIQMSLYRFSIFPKLLSCVGAAYLVCDSGRLPRLTARLIAVGVPLVIVLALSLLRIFGGRAAHDIIWRQPGPIGLFVALCCGLALYELSRSRSEGQSMLHPIAIAALLAVLGFGWGRWMGFDFGYSPQPRADHVAMCEYVRNSNHTPIDAVFLVSPSDEMFRLHARRAIVVNFKAVPQLSSELAVWQKRICDVLGLQKLSELSRPYHATLWDMERRYNALPEAHLAEVAELYGARYILTRRRLSPAWDAKIAFGSGEYLLYDRQK